MSGVRRLKSLIVFALLMAALPDVALAQEGGTPPDKIVVEREGLFPEGIEYDAAEGRFLLSSLVEGTIYAVQDDGTYTPFIEDEDLMSTIGIHIDKMTNRLLVCNSKSAFMQGWSIKGPQAMLMAYDLEGGERLFAVDLTDLGPGIRHFCNDVTVDQEGNAYATDSYAPVIYKVDPNGNAAVLVENQLLSSWIYGLNGIDYHPDGFLLVVKSGEGMLYKVPLDDPSNVTQVEVNGDIWGADGIVLADDGSLYVVCFAARQHVSRLVSEDGWETATIVERAPAELQATTATLRDGSVYVVYSHQGEFDSATPPASFEIVRASFEPAD